MKIILLTLLLGTSWTSLAAAESAAPLPHADCTAQAQSQDLEGPALKSFMKTCLAGNAAASAAPMSQREKMTKCNADAHGMKGPERRQFMSGCLSKKPAGRSNQG